VLKTIAESITMSKCQLLKAVRVNLKTCLIDTTTQIHTSKIAELLLGIESITEVAVKYPVTNLVSTQTGCSTISQWIPGVPKTTLDSKHLLLTRIIP